MNHMNFYVFGCWFWRNDEHVRSILSCSYFFPDFLMPPLTRGPLPAALAAISLSFFCSSLCLACRAWHEIWLLWMDHSKWTHTLSSSSSSLFCFLAAFRGFFFPPSRPDMLSSVVWNVSHITVWVQLKDVFISIITKWEPLENPKNYQVTLNRKTHFQTGPPLCTFNPSSYNTPSLVNGQGRSWAQSFYLQASSCRAPKSESRVMDNRSWKVLKVCHRHHLLKQ